MKKKNNNIKTKSTSKQLNANTKIFIQTQLIYLILCLVTFITACIVAMKLDVSRQSIFYICIACFGFSAFSSSFYAGYKIHKNGIAIGLLFSLPITSILMLTSAIFNGFKVDLTLVFAFSILLIIAMLGGIVSVNIHIKAKK